MDFVIGILLMIIGVGIILFWAQHIATGGLPKGIRTLESNGYIAFHVTAEIVTGITCILGGLALALDFGWGLPVGLIASGMLAYTGINSLAWRGVRNSPPLSVVFIIAFLIAGVSGVYLLVSYLTQ